jgi:hypothetical protein
LPMPFILANAWLASALMKSPEFRLPYMAILGGLASDLPTRTRTSAMTHLSWDEFGARVLERRNSRDPGRAAGLRPRGRKALGT